MSLPFRGKAITWWQVVGPRQGIARTYVDGVLTTTVNGYAAATKVVARTLSVSDAQHALRILVTESHISGSVGNGVSVDRWTIT